MKTLKDAIKTLKKQVDVERFNFKIMQGRKEKQLYKAFIREIKDCLRDIFNSDYKIDYENKIIYNDCFKITKDHTKDKQLIIYQHVGNGRYKAYIYLGNNLINNYQSFNDLYNILTA